MNEMSSLGEDLRCCPWRLESESHPVVSNSLWPHGLYCPWNSLGQNTGVGSLSLLQGIFPTQGSNPGLPHCRRILYQLSCKGSPRILERVAYPFSSRSSWPRNQTRSSALQSDYLPTELSWKPKGVLNAKNTQANFFSGLILLFEILYLWKPYGCLYMHNWFRENPNPQFV